MRKFCLLATTCLLLSSSCRVSATDEPREGQGPAEPKLSCEEFHTQARAFVADFADPGEAVPCESDTDCTYVSRESYCANMGCFQPIHVSRQEDWDTSWAAMQTFCRENGFNSRNCSPSPGSCVQPEPVCFESRCRFKYEVEQEILLRQQSEGS